MSEQDTREPRSIVTYDRTTREYGQVTLTPEADQAVDRWQSEVAALLTGHAHRVVVQALVAAGVPPQDADEAVYMAMEEVLENGPDDY